jgi:23S rRNA (cytidine2498-2'-O)-methyltransferase
VITCRAGFEPECGQEIRSLAHEAGIGGDATVTSGSAFVVFRTSDPHDAHDLMSAIRFDRLVFGRQWFACLPRLEGLPSKDRLSPVLAAARSLGTTFSHVDVEAPDTDEGRDLMTFCRKFSAPLVSALTREGLLAPGRPVPRLHAFYMSSGVADLGVSDPDNSSPWFMGIPRLRMPRGSPSRSVLKLDEAWHTFIPAGDWDRVLARGMRAVDLGASPGGWTLLLARRSMLVTAVDNGPMDRAVMGTGQVEHLRADGFTYEPRAPVDWVVCDMVEQPSRVAKLMVKWIGRGLADRAIFNLKLPMKKRWAELQRCREIVTDGLAAAGVRADFRMKHLYHDREEVTAYLARVEAGPRMPRGGRALKRRSGRGRGSSPPSRACRGGGRS